MLHVLGDKNRKQREEIVTSPFEDTTAENLVIWKPDPLIQKL